MLSRLNESRYRDLLIISPVFLLFVALLSLSLTEPFPGDAGLFISSGVTVFPFVILAMLAYESVRHPWLRYIAILWLLVILFALFSISLLITLAPAAAFSADSGALDAVSIESRAMPAALCAALACLLGFSRRFRALLARVLPFDPDSHVHMIALVCMISLIVMPVVPLAVNGQAPLLDAELQALLGVSGEEPGSSVKTDTYTLIWTVVGSLFVAGLWVKRSGAETLQRLGFVWPTGRQALFGIVSGILLASVFLVLDGGIFALFSALHIPVTDEALARNLFIGSFTPLAALVASISAGLGEELSIRGVFQPRFGIIASALMFATLHAYQYAWDGILSVFLAGICFGIIRNYTNTSTSAISHGVYDLVLFALILAGFAII